MVSRKFKIFQILFFSILFFFLWSLGLSDASERNANQILIDQIKEATSGMVSIAYHSKTGYVRFIGTDLQHPVQLNLPSDATPEKASRAFLSIYGSLFGLTDQAMELKTIRSKTADRGRSFVRFQQIYNGIPVLGAELNVQTDAGKNILSANGKVLPGIKVDIMPRIDAETAKEIALGKIAKVHGLTVFDLVASKPELWIYNPIMLKPSRDFNSLVWRMEVKPKKLLPIRELVLVDAHTGIVALHFNQINFARNRMTYTAGNTTTLPGTLVCNEANTDCTGGDSHAVNAHIYTRDTYDFYNSYHGRDSINNAGMTLTSSVHYGTDYCNAFWNGSQMVYGDGCFIVSDDVVGHEITHGVTDYESRLFYYYQSGAINESLSDVWGEFVDLINGRGNDSSSVRWLMGEDISIGAIRSMSNPPAYGDPDRIGNSTYYWCAETDNGGVHINSGVNNKAAYLLTDGGTFNGKTVTGLGITKVAKIYYEAQTNLLLSASDYNDLYNLLQQACTNLIGTSGITSANCQEVKDAVDATEMNQQPASCTANEAAFCSAGQEPSHLFFDNLENTSSGNWVSGALSGTNSWYYPQTFNPYGFDATYATSGQYNFWGYDQPATADFFIRMNLDVALPAGSTPYLHFNHAYGFEDDASGTWWDGGVVEYSTNGGTSWNDAGSLFINNGYNGTIATGYGNPLGGRSAFVDESNGYYSSRLNLYSLAGQNVRFRFRIGTDSSVDDYGWFIDDIRIYTCTAPMKDLAVDFGAGYGLWIRYNNSTWTKIHSLTPDAIAIGDLDGSGIDDLVVDFGGSNGLWIRYNNSTWSKIHSLSPELIATGDFDGSGIDDLVVDFGGSNGLWIRYNNSTWSKIHSLSPDAVAVGDIDVNSKDDLVVDFGGSNGLWIRYNNSTWSKIHSTSPELIATGNFDGSMEDGGDDLIVDFGADGLWIRWNNTSSWSKIHSLSPQVIATGDLDADGRDDLVVDFGADGLWIRYNNSTWSKIHSLSPELIAIGDLDGSGIDDLIVDFGADGLWIRYNNSTWSKIHSLSPDVIDTGKLN